MHALLAERRCDLPRDVVRAFDEVRDDEDIAHALAAIGAEDSPAASRAHRGNVYVGR